MVRSWGPIDEGVGIGEDFLFLIEIRTDEGDRPHKKRYFDHTPLTGPSIEVDYSDTVPKV
jgi:hypothetical protein